MTDCPKAIGRPRWCACHGWEHETTEQHECVHKWEPDFRPCEYIDDTMTESATHYARCLQVGCDAKLTEAQTRAILNEYETMKRNRNDLAKLVAIILCWKPEWLETPYFNNLPDQLRKDLVELAKSTMNEGGGASDEWLSKLEGKDG